MNKNGKKLIIKYQKIKQISSQISRFSFPLLIFENFFSSFGSSN